MAEPLETKTSGASVLLQRAFKLRFVLRLCLVVLAGGAGLLALLYSSLSTTVGGTYGEAIYTIYDLKLKILPLIFASSYSLLMLGLVTAAVAAISVLYSHKIAGPLYRIERSLDLIGSGDLTVVTRFRGNDQLSALADDLNAMVRSANHSARALMDALDELREAESALGGLLEAGDPPRQELEAAMGRVRSAAAALSRAAAHIRAAGGRA